MHHEKAAADDPYRSFAERIDSLTVPIALGFVTMLLVVQAVMQVPSVHQTLDKWRSGFAAIPTQVTSHQQASVELYLSPSQTSSNIVVLVNGKQVADFSRQPFVNISVQPSDVITVVNDSGHLVYATVNQNDPSLVVPAPGQRVVVEPNTQADFPSARFQIPAS